MAIPNMDAITASLERSLQNFSLNNQQSDSSTSSNDGVVAAESPENPPLNSTNDRTLELNSEGALPYHWEQCLDLETGEIYYINWKTGMRSEEDPRTTAVYGGDYYSEDDGSSCGSYEDDSEGSSTETSPCCSREQLSCNSNDNNQGQEDCHYQDEKSGNSNSNSNNDSNSLSVLVVAGCKGCFMYYMVPKQNVVCPKCCGQLIHFDRSENGSA